MSGIQSKSLAENAQNLLDKRDDNARRYNDSGQLDDRQFVTDMRELLATYQAALQDSLQAAE